MTCHIAHKIKRCLSLSLFIFILLGTISINNTPAAKAAKLSDGTWAQGGTPGTTTITYTNATALDSSSDIVLTFPSTATIDSTGANITVTGQGTVVRSNDTVDNTITLTIDGTIDAAVAVTITMSDALLSYTTTTYAMESLAINTQDSSDTPIDFGVALMTNDNTILVETQVPLFVNLAVDTTNIDLGTLSTASVNEADQTYTVNSNNRTGVTIQFTADGDMDDGFGNTINDVADGTVSAGSEEYGISTDNVSNISMTAPYDAGDDAIPQVATTIAETVAEVSNGIFDVNYKASITGTTIAGAYDQVVTFTVSTKS